VRINHRKRLAVVLSTAMLMSMLPATAFAESSNKPAVTNAAAKAVPSSEGDIMKEGFAAPVDVAITKEKAEALARQYVSIPKEYVLQGASLNMEVMASGKRNAWGLDFVKKVNGKHLGSIYVRIHADKGQLLEFNSYTDNPSAKPTYPLKVERDAAQQIALQFIDKIAADYKGQIQYNPDYGVQLRPPLTGEVVHSIRYDRLVNDIPYVDNYIELEVDSEGHVRRFSLQWDDTIIFPKVDAKLSAAEANEKLRAAAAPLLAYIVPYNMQGKRKPLLSYELQPISIDAVTGQLKDQSRDNYFRAGTISETPISEKPLGEEPKAGAVTEKQAIDAVKAAFALPAGVELNGSNYSENSNESTGETEAFWQLNWTVKKDGKEVGSASASVNGRTGEVRHFNTYMYNEQSQSGGTKVTLEQASTAAVEAIKKRLPWLTDELYLVKPDPKQYEGIVAGQPSQYYFNFVHKIYGAVVEYDNISLSIHSSTGEVVNYDANLSNFVYIRYNSYANNAASSPPAAPRISTITFLSSLGSFGNRTIRICSSSTAWRLLNSSISILTISRISSSSFSACISLASSSCSVTCLYSVKASYASCKSDCSLESSLSRLGSLDTSGSHNSSLSFSYRSASACKRSNTIIHLCLFH